MVDAEAMGDEHLRGVGGWLVVFLVLFAAYPVAVVPSRLGHLLYVFRGGGGGIVLIARFGPIQYDISFVSAIIEWVGLFAGLALVGYTIFRLIYRRDRDTIRFTQAAIVVVAFVIPVVESMLVLAARLGSHLLFLYFEQLLVRSNIRSAVFGAVFSAIWIAYFQVSKRVKNTYLRQDEFETQRVFD